MANFGDPDVPGAPLFASGTSVLTEDAQGNIYSTTPDGGRYRRGAAYKVTPDGKMTVLYDFGQPLGGPPEMPVRRNFYGRVWLVPPETPRYAPRWLNANYFTAHYKYFTYTMKTKVKKSDGTMITVTQNDMAPVTEMLRETWLKDETNKGMADWP